MKKSCPIRICFIARISTSGKDHRERLLAGTPLLLYNLPGPEHSLANVDLQVVESANRRAFEFLRDHFEKKSP
jgi:hypothetical protein